MPDWFRAGIGRVARVDGHVPSYLGTPSKGRTLECGLCYVSASGGAVLQTQTDHSAGPILPKRRARYAFLGHEWSLIFSWYVWMEGSRGDAPVPGWGIGPLVDRRLASRRPELELGSQSGSASGQCAFLWLPSCSCSGLLCATEYGNMGITGYMKGHESPALGASGSSYQPSCSGRASLESLS